VVKPRDYVAAARYADLCIGPYRRDVATMLAQRGGSISHRSATINSEIGSLRPTWRTGHHNIISRCRLRRSPPPATTSPDVYARECIGRWGAFDYRALSRVGFVRFLTEAKLRDSADRSCKGARVT